MPSSTMIIKSNDGNLQYANLHWNSFYGDNVTVTSTGLNFPFVPSTATTNEGAAYDETAETLTLPITITGFATEANATTPTYNVGDSIPLVVGTQTIYATGATMKSYDLSTSTKWDSLSAGNHSVTIVAKAAGYRDSVSSTAITVVKGSAGETWVLNETIPITSTETFTVNFTTTGTEITSWSAIFVNHKGYIEYGSGGGAYEVYGGIDAAVWHDEAYRTITFNDPVTDNTLLTWLQANGTKQ